MSDVTHYLYRIQPARKAMLTEGPTPGETQCVQRHFAYLQELASRDILLLAGRTLNNDQTTFGIVIVRAASEQEARDIMLRDPSVAEGVMNGELFPYRIALFNAAAANAA